MIGVPCHQDTPIFQGSCGDDQIRVFMRESALAAENPQISSPIENWVRNWKNDSLLAKLSESCYLSVRFLVSVASNNLISGHRGNRKRTMSFCVSQCAPSNSIIPELEKFGERIRIKQGEFHTHLKIRVSLAR
jgi:hypothetical protein